MMGVPWQGRDTIQPCSISQDLPSQIGRKRSTANPEPCSVLGLNLWDRHTKFSKDGSVKTKPRGFTTRTGWVLLQPEQNSCLYHNTGFHLMEEGSGEHTLFNSHVVAWFGMMGFKWQVDPILQSADSAIEMQLAASPGITKSQEHIPDVCWSQHLLYQFCHMSSLPFSLILSGIFLEDAPHEPFWKPLFHSLAVPEQGQDNWYWTI